MGMFVSDPCHKRQNSNITYAAHGDKADDGETLRCLVLHVILLACTEGDYGPPILICLGKVLHLDVFLPSCCLGIINSVCAQLLDWLKLHTTHRCAAVLVDNLCLRRPSMDGDIAR